jgi:hypothetical protein
LRSRPSSVGRSGTSEAARGGVVVRSLAKR